MILGRVAESLQRWCKVSRFALFFFTGRRVCIESVSRIYMLKSTIIALAGVAQLVGMTSHKSKGRKFDSQSGHMPGLWVQSWSGCI